jgi:UDP-N-acetyl-D-glucosamine dehydrogenase
VLVLGVTYKRDIEDVRESPALDIISLLQSKGALAEYHDPIVATLEIGELRDDPITIKSIELTEEAIRAYDVAVIVTDHSSYDYDWIVRNSKLVVDTRNATKQVEDRTKIRLL